MNIRDYYGKMADVYLHQLILIAMALTMFLVVLSAFSPLFYMKWILLAVLIILVYYFARYGYFYVRKKQTTFRTPYKGKEPDETSYMALNMPSEKYELNFYKSSGICEWMIQMGQPGRKKRSSGIHFQLLKNNCSLSVNGTFQIDGSFYAILNNNGKKISIRLVDRRKDQIILMAEKTEYYLKKNKRNISIYHNGAEAASYEKGFMPFSWQINFSPNTPILRLNTKNEEEQIIVLTLLLGFLQKYLTFR